MTCNPLRRVFLCPQSDILAIQHRRRDNNV
nr:MAG TPA: hypothetical protein [Caudoviricetes sp.]